MRISKLPYPLSTLYGLRARINPEPDYQRPSVWTTKQKQLLIDSILRGYDIPKMYWHRLKNPEEENYEFAVIDGQQRLRTVWEFCGGKFALPKDTDTIDGIEVAKKHYADLDFNLRSSFDIYSFDVVIVEDAIQNEKGDEITDMFLRLQNGTTLKAQEKRNAMPGNMKDFIKDISKHQFFENCKFNNLRFAYDHIAAQMVCLEIAGEPTNVKDADLNKIYKKNTTFDKTTDDIAKRVKRTLDFLLRAFPERTEELERYNTITLYSISSTLVQRYVHAGTEVLLHDWFIQFETQRRDNETKNEDDRNPELVDYRRLISYSTDSVESIKSRLEFLQKRFFLAHPKIELLDNNRNFTSEQRLAIYRKFDGLCQLKTHCNGEKLMWDNWHADHIDAHSKGGKTIVSNGQVTCAPCNLDKSNN